MIRATKAVQEDVCPGCQQAILITNWDDQSGLEVSTYRVDPTPLTLEQETVCVVIGRRTYLLEETIAGTWRLSWRYPGNQGIPDTGYAISVLPHHLCGARFPGQLILPARPTFDTSTPTPF